RLAGAAIGGAGDAAGSAAGAVVGGAGPVLRVGVGTGDWVGEICRGWITNFPLRLPCASTFPAGPGSSQYRAGCGFVAGESLSRMRRCRVRLAPAARSNGPSSLAPGDGSQPGWTARRCQVPPERSSSWMSGADRYPASWGVGTPVRPVRVRDARTSWYVLVEGLWTPTSNSRYAAPRQSSAGKFPRTRNAASITVTSNVVAPRC